MRPGVDVISRALPPPRSAPTDTGVAFVIGPTASGDAVNLTHSLTEYVALCGDRTAGNEVTYDAADVYFREGGALLYVAPTNVVGGGGLSAPAPAPSAADLEAMTRGELDVYATSLGLDPAEYGTKADELAAIEALDAAPRAVDTGIAAALAALTKDLGPGQVFVADPVLAAAVDTQSALLAHAQACNRVALLSCADGDATALLAAGAALQTDANARYGGLFAPSAVVPGVVAGTTRTVPYAAVEAGIISRNDVAYNPNIAAAGELGQAVFALDVNGRYSDADYQALNDGAVDMARLVYGGVRTYGYRSCVDPDITPEWLDLGWARLNMAIAAQAEAIGERYVFSQLDGRGRTLSQFGGELTAMLATYYDQGALYGDTAEDAYNVDVGSTVNTPATIANGELHAVIEVRMSPFAEWVVIEIVKVATTQALPAVAA
jgi:hypothetical protein